MENAGEQGSFRRVSSKFVCLFGLSCNEKRCGSEFFNETSQQDIGANFKKSSRRKNQHK